MKDEHCMNDGHSQGHGHVYVYVVNVIVVVCWLIVIVASMLPSVCVCSMHSMPSMRGGFKVICVCACMCVHAAYVST